MYNILKISLKVKTTQDFSKAFLLFPSMSHGVKVFDFDAAPSEWKILASQCVDKNLKSFDVLQKSEKMKHILP